MTPNRLAVGANLEPLIFERSRPGVRGARTPLLDVPAPQAKLLKANARELNSTLITAAIKEPVTAGTNLVWCATLPLAWNEMVGLTGQKVEFLDGLPIRHGPAFVGPDQARIALKRRRHAPFEHEHIAALLPGLLGHGHRRGTSSRHEHRVVRQVDVLKQHVANGQLPDRRDVGKEVQK